MTGVSTFPSQHDLHLFCSSVKNLHERWAKDCAVYRELYDQVQDLELKQRIDWAPLLDNKLVSEHHKPVYSIPDLFCDSCSVVTVKLVCTVLDHHI